MIVGFFDSLTAMIIERTPPRYPRRGPSCLLVIFVLFGIIVGGFVIQNADEVRDTIIPTATPEPTRSATEYAMLATLSKNDGEYVEAIEYYDEAIRLDATKPQFYIDLIELLVRTGQPERALTEAEEVTELAPDNDQVWMAIAAAYIVNGDRLRDIGDINGANLQFAQAVQAADAAIDLNPNNATALAYKAGGLVFQENPELYEQARIAADEAIFLEPSNPIARYYMAEVFTLQGFYDAAREQYQLGIQADWSFVDLHIGLAYNFFAGSRVPEAILSFKEAIEIDPDNAAAYDGLAHMYLQLGQDVQAEENALKSVELNPNVARAHGRLGEAYFRQNKYTLAIEEFGKAVALYGQPTPINARFFYLMGEAYLREGTQFCPDAVPLFEQVVSVGASVYEESALEGLVECRRVSLETLAESAPETDLDLETTPVPDATPTAATP